MSAIISTLRKRILTPKGKFRPGALSRISELLGCSRSTVKNVFCGDWTFSEERLEILSKINWTEFPLYRKKPGPKPENNCGQ